ncbi:MAG: hypothetical protein KGJ62_10560 [Armatimonadetes bacterium]|nr:hypothetical protein [Armatimonadota bacterium]MDE2207141.1 hypothetical protein [Armatimonadota bacterium]
MNHANDMVRVLLSVFSIAIIMGILLARRRNLYIRRIQGLTAIDEAIGRATEMGRPMVCTTGLGVNGGIEIVTLQALSIITYIIRESAQFGARAICPVFDPQMQPVTEEAVRDSYIAAGRPELYNPDDVRFLTNRQFAYAAAVAGLVMREKAAATFLFGYYYAESLVIAEVGQQVGAIQIAGTTATTQIPFFIAACDYVIIGDEFYAASAYLSREPTQLGSLVGQDFCKGVLLAIMVLGSLIATGHAPWGEWLVHQFMRK